MGSLGGSVPHTREPLAACPRVPVVPTDNAFRHRGTLGKVYGTGSKLPVALLRTSNA
jgi:hypothetical protein